MYEKNGVPRKGPRNIENKIAYLLTRHNLHREFDHHFVAVHIRALESEGRRYSRGRVGGAGLLGEEERTSSGSGIRCRRSISADVNLVVLFNTIGIGGELGAINTQAAVIRSIQRSGVLAIPTTVTSNPLVIQLAVVEVFVNNLRSFILGCSSNFASLLGSNFRSPNSVLSVVRRFGGRIIGTPMPIPNILVVVDAVEDGREGVNRNQRRIVTTESVLNRTN